MQTTLLGLAIAFIIAMITALIGPYFIDWNQFRPQFEAEASRVIGSPVRVGGALDARLLPAPSLRLHDITVGGGYDLGKIRADKLDVEFSLGSLMRGEWRATELTLGGASADIGLDARGRVDLPLSADKFNLGALAIDRLNITGRLALYDAASRATLELNDIAFSGDVRSLAGAMRGDGNFTLSGARYPFRISSGPAADGRGTRVHLSVDPGQRPLSVDVDGVLTFVARSPRFDGGLVVARPAGTKAAAADQPVPTPWRLTSRLKLDPSVARLEQVEASYGIDDAALKASGIADFRFGDAPTLNVSLSARQFDADRLLAKGDSDKGSTQLLAEIGKLVAALPPTPLATQIAISAEQIMLGGRPIQNLDADLRGDMRSWSISRLDFRAPGATRVALSGELAEPGPSASFKGAASIDSTDPDTLAAWLQGRSEVTYRSQKPLRFRGNLSASADHLAIDALTAEIDGSAVEGHVRFSDRSAGGRSLFDAALKADSLDLDSFAALVRSLGGPSEEWPDSAQVSLDLGSAVSAGQEMKPFVAQFGYGPETISLDRFRTGDVAGLMIDGSGAFNRRDATGKLAVIATSASLGHVAKLLKQFAPDMAARVAAMTPAPGQVNVKLALDLEKSREQADRTLARAVIDIKSAQLNGAITVSATPATLALRGADMAALAQSDISLDARLDAAQGRDLLTLLGLDKVVAAGKAPLRFEAIAKGNSRAPAAVIAKLAGSNLDADVKGNIELWGAHPRAELVLAIRKANVAPLLELDRPDFAAQNVSLMSRLTYAGDKLVLDDIDSAIGGSRVRGKITLGLGAEKEINGQLGMDAIAIGPALAVAFGVRGRDLGEPLGSGLSLGWRGQVSFQALHGTLPGDIDLRPVAAVVKSDGTAFSIAGFKAGLGGGEITADIDVGQTTGGRSLNAQVVMSNVDGAALKYRGLIMPAGRASLKMSLASLGRSAAGLQGALSGEGLLSIEGGRLPGLDASAFDAAIRASDSGRVADDDKLRRTVDPVLSWGAMAFPSAQIPFVIKDGRLRVSATTLDAKAAKLTFAGGYDFAADQADIRATLAMTATATEQAGAEITVFLSGSPDRLDRLVDVSTLSSWLALRAIDRETRRLEALQRETTADPKPEPSVQLPGASSTENNAGDNNARNPRLTPPHTALPRGNNPSEVSAPVASELTPLPPPIEVKPAPGTPRPSPRPRPAPPLVLTPSAPNASAPTAF